MNVILFPPVNCMNLVVALLLAYLWMPYFSHYSQSSDLISLKSSLYMSFILIFQNKVLKLVLSLAPITCVCLTFLHNSTSFSFNSSRTMIIIFIPNVRYCNLLFFLLSLYVYILFLFLHILNLAMRFHFIWSLYKLILSLYLKQVDVTVFCISMDSTICQCFINYSLCNMFGFYCT